MATIKPRNVLGTTAVYQNAGTPVRAVKWLNVLAGNPRQSVARQFFDLFCSTILRYTTMPFCGCADLIRRAPFGIDLEQVGVTFTATKS